jgi:hypothetical protein
MKINVTPLNLHPNDPEFRARQAIDYRRPSGVAEIKPVSPNSGHWL